MKYLKVYTDFVQDMKELGDAERGRLFTAMLIYADTGIEPELKGNERFSWGTAKKNIDSQRKSFDRKSAAGTASANTRWGNNGEESRMPNDANVCQTMPNDANVCQKCETHQEHEHEQEQEHKKENITPLNPPKGKADIFAEFCSGDKTLLDALRAFDAMRKKIRKPMTDEAKRLLLKKLEREPRSDWVPMLEEATLNSWLSVYPLKNRKSGNTGKTADMLHDSYRMMEDWANG